MSEQVPQPAPEKTKAELFAENPDRFIDQKDVILMVRRNPDNGCLGMMIRIAETMQDQEAEGVDKATTMDVYEETLKLQAYCHRKLGTFLAVIEHGIAKRQAATSIVPAKKNGGFLNGVRSIGRR